MWNKDGEGGVMMHGCSLRCLCGGNDGKTWWKAGMWNGAHGKVFWGWFFVVVMHVIACVDC